MPSGISIILCCYNSELRLPATLRHIAAQEVDETLRWEVLVINNNSQDHTTEIAIQEWSKYNIPYVNFRIIDEPRPGLSFARARGIKESAYDFLLFCDDDNWLSPNYLTIGAELFITKPELGVIGGKGIEAPEVEPSDWFTKHRLTYAIGPQHEMSGDITASKGEVYGAGAFFRKEALTKLYKNGFHSLLSDRTGTQLASGGDSELCICVKILGYRIWYDERLTFFHYIPKERLKKEYFIRLHKGISQSLTRLLPYYFLINSSIDYQTRSWIRKHWIWFLACRMSHILFQGFAWNLFKMRFNTELTDRNLKAIFFHESMKTILKERGRMALKHKAITNSKWYREARTV